MKTTIFTLLPMVLLALSTNTLPVASQPVFDTAGDALMPGSEYYASPYITAMGGGLDMNLTNDTCQPDVIQQPLEVNNGLPLKFWPWNSRVGFIPTSLNLIVQFSAVPRCPRATVWKVINSADEPEKYLVTGGGILGGPPNCDTFNSWFTIEKAEGVGELNVYKFNHCPTTFCPIFLPICSDIGIYNDNGIRRLALSEEPLKVVFVKVEKSTLWTSEQKI